MSGKYTTAINTNSFTSAIRTDSRKCLKEISHSHRSSLPILPANRQRYEVSTKHSCMDLKMLVEGIVYGVKTQEGA